MKDTILYKPFKAHINTKTTLPGRIHADGAPTTKVDSIFTINWCSQVAEGPTIGKKLIFTCVKKSDMVDGTLERLWDYFAWAMNALLEGKVPQTDHRGRRLANAGQPLKTKGWTMACNQVAGDWEFYANDLHLNRWDSEPNMCFVCGASNSIANLMWTNGTCGAGWRHTYKTHESYCAEMAAAGKTLSHIFKIYTLRLEGVMIDILHAVDQGVAIHVIANVFMEVRIVSQSHS